MHQFLVGLFVLLLFIPALALGGGTGFAVFRLIQGTRWPTIIGRYVAAALASIAGLFVFLTLYWVTGLTSAFSHDGTHITLDELLRYALIMGPVYAAFIVLRYTRLGRWLTRPIRWGRGA